MTYDIVVLFLIDRYGHCEGGGYGFFLKKYSDSQFAEKNILILVEGKKKNLIQSVCHIS
jgi:hypothetical protein